MNTQRHLLTAAAFLFLLSNTAHAALATVQADAQWSNSQKESDHDYRCPSNKVLVGRKHYKDENGSTWYLCGTVTQGSQLQTFNEEKLVISYGGGSCPFPKVVTGRGRTGDENSEYWLYCAEVRDSWGEPLVPTSTDTRQGLENAHDVRCPQNQVLGGMRRYGDEEDLTRYYCSKLF